MKKNTKLAVGFALLIGIVGFSALIVHNYKTKTSFRHTLNQVIGGNEVVPENHEQDTVNAAVNKDAEANLDSVPAHQKKSETLKITADDFIYGDKKAPIQIIEYASLSCPHCAGFHKDGFSKLKEDFIDSGKAQFIYRNFPLNQPALIASMLAYCKAKDDPNNSSETYYNFIKVLFKTQDVWAFDQKFLEKLEGIGRLDSISSERFQSCTKDTKLQEKILAARMAAAQDLQIQSTPTFFVNGEASEGYVDYQTLKKLIEKKIAEIEAKKEVKK